MFAVSRSNISATANTRSAGFTANGPAFHRMISSYKSMYSCTILRQNKLKSPHGFCIPTSCLKENKVTPSFSFGTTASSLKLNKSKLVFGSAAPAFNTGCKFPVPISEEPSKPKFGGLSSDTASVEELEGNTANLSPSTIASSCNTELTLNFPHRRYSTALKETSNVSN